MSEGEDFKIEFVDIWDNPLPVHWNFPDRKESDIVMTQNGKGKYEITSGCPICDIERKTSNE